MMAGGIGLGQALQLISGVPLRKVATAKFENLHLPKRLEGSGIGGLLRQVLQDGGLQSIAQNPLQAITSQLQGGIAQAATQLQSALGGAATQAVQALTGGGGLASAVSSFVAAGNNLAGLTNSSAGYHAMQGHEALVGMLGADVPEALSLDRVVAPIADDALIEGIEGELCEAVASVIAGTMPVADLAAWAGARTGAVNTVVTASADALTQGQAIMPLVSSVAAMAGALTDYPGAAATPFQAVLGSIIRPEARAVMDAGLAAAKALAVDRIAQDVEKITSLED